MTLRTKNRWLIFVVIALVAVIGYIKFGDGAFGELSFKKDKSSSSVEQTEKDIMATEDKSQTEIEIKNVADLLTDCISQRQKENENKDYEKDSILVSWEQAVSFAGAKQVVESLDYAIINESETESSWGPEKHWFAVEVGVGNVFSFRTDL